MLASEQWTQQCWSIFETSACCGPHCETEQGTCGGCATKQAYQPDAGLLCFMCETMKFALAMVAEQAVAPPVAAPASRNTAYMPKPAAAVFLAASQACNRATYRVIRGNLRLKGVAHRTQF